MTTYPVSFRSTDTGLSLNSASFVVFQKLSDGSAPTNAAPNTITEVGFGVYRFEYTPAEDVVFVLDGGAGLPDTDRYVRGVLSPQDARIDAAVSSRASQTSLDALQTDVDFLRQIAEGRWKIFSTGPDANRIVFYDSDDVTPIAKFDLKDIGGNPTYTVAFERTPVP